eukprot:ctg_4009.g607
MDALPTEPGLDPLPPAQARHDLFGAGGAGRRRPRDGHGAGTRGARHGAHAGVAPQRVRPSAPLGGGAAGRRRRQQRQHRDGMGRPGAELAETGHAVTGGYCACAGAGERQGRLRERGQRHTDAEHGRR